MFRVFRVFSLAFGVVAFVLAGSAQAGLLTSGTFSLGYGFTGSGWDTSETSSANTATTLGDFTFFPNVSGSGGARRDALFRTAY